MPSTTEASGLLIVGYGNTLRGDDAIGPVAARELRVRGLPAIECQQLTPELAEPLSRVERAIFIDADARLQAGEVRVAPLSADSSTLDHHATPAALLRLTQDVYGRAPEGVLISVGPESFELGRKLSGVAAMAIEEVLDRVGILY